jgi:hypothetical protein
MGNGGKDIRLAVPDVPALVLVKVDGQAEEVGGHELALAQGPGPGAHQPFRGGRLLVDDAQGRQQLGAEEFAAVGARGPVGQGGQGADDGSLAHVAAKIAFDGPQGDDKLGRHPVLGADLFEQGAVLGQALPGGLHPAGRHHPLQIGGQGDGVFGLALLQGEDLRAGPQSGQGLVQGALGHALGQGLLAHACEPGGEILFLGRHCGGPEQQSKGDGHGGSLVERRWKFAFFAPDSQGPVPCWKMYNDSR